MRDRDDQSRRDNILRDPRRDPTDPPPAPAQDAPEVRLVMPEPAPPPEPEPKDEEPEPPAPSSRRRPERREMPKPTDGSSVVTSFDPRITELEPLVASGDWEAVRKLLGSTEDAGKLPPNLGLIYALAHKESVVEKVPAKTETSDPYDPNLVAIRCMAGVCGLPVDSPIAVVLGKRITRSNPVAWQKKKAPPAPISILIVALGLLLGAGIGWLLSFGYVTFKLPTIPSLP
jgi:hypothetical protein